MIVVNVFKEADREPSDLRPSMTGKKLGLLVRVWYRRFAWMVYKLTHMYYMLARHPSDALGYLWTSSNLYRGDVPRRGDTVGQVVTHN